IQGIYLVTFFSCLQVLLFENGRLKGLTATNKTLLVAALLMFVFGTLDVALGLRHNLDAFVYTTGTPEEEFAHISYWVNVMKIVNYDAQTFIGDGILLYRCFIIYNRAWLIIILPALMWIGTAVCSVLAVYIEATLGTGVLTESQLKPFITGTLSLTLAMNIITTDEGDIHSGLIIHRILLIQSNTVGRLTRTSGISPPSRVVKVLIECGAIYTVSVLILFGCYLSSNNAQLGVSDSIVQIIGITFNLIILNVGRGTATTSQPVTTNTFISSDQWSSEHRASRATGLHHVNITRVTNVTRDGLEEDKNIQLNHLSIEPESNLKPAPQWSVTAV
ncbi:hypothetical protein BDQ12DRAFT_616759, partial [Crucibulum laeve]